MIIIWLVGDVECNQIHFGFNFVRIWRNNIKLVNVKMLLCMTFQNKTKCIIFMHQVNHNYYMQQKNNNNIHINY